MHPNLSFEQAPPISVPYRFFLSAPLFGIAAGLLIAFTGAEFLASRWTPAALALNHLMVAGFMLQAMCGALFQFIPVVAGGNIGKPRLVAGIVHPLLLSGTLLLTGGFVSGAGLVLEAGGGLLALGLAIFIVTAGLALFRAPAGGAILWSLRLAVAALTLTVILGLALLAGLHGSPVFPQLEATDVHAAWGLGGWGLLLLSGVAYNVVPMFQLTPPYPAWITRVLPAGMLIALALWSFKLTGRSAAWQDTVLLAGMALAAGFAVITLRLQAQRRRRVPDATLALFRVAMISLAGIFCSALLFRLVPQLGSDPRAALWIGILALAGVFVSAINGMLYKIVPFLNWLHLQRQAGMTAALPNMKDMIGDRAMHGQMKLHVAALAVLLSAVFVPALARPAGVLLAASSAWLLYNLLRAAALYRRFKDRIRAVEPYPAP